jgi:hypothetical protein
MTTCFRDKTKNTFFYCFCFILLLFASCNKKDEAVGADFVGQRSGIDILSADTFSVIAYSSKDDSTTQKNIRYQYIGAMNDPIFGKTETNLFTQFSIPVNQFTFDNKTIDSVVLQLPYIGNNNYYGNLITNQQISVYKLTEKLSTIADSAYFGNRTYQYDKGNLLGTFTGTFNLNDSMQLTVGGVSYKTPAHLRIRLDNLKTMFEAADAAKKFNDDATFKDFFNGLALISSASAMGAGQGAISYLNLINTTASLVVYYDGGKQKADFRIATTDIKTNSFVHEVSPSIQLMPLLSNTHQNVTYVKPMDGIKTRVLLPNLKTVLMNKKIAVIGAEMVFTVKDATDDGTYTLPPYLLLTGSDSIGRNKPISDEFENILYYKGGYTASTREYRFNITRHMQKLFMSYAANRDENYGLNLIVPHWYDNFLVYPFTSQRVVLDNNVSLKKIRLVLNYTVVN